MSTPNIFNIVLIWPIINVLVAIYQGLTHLHVPYALGFAIIALTIIIRLLLYPLIASQLKATRKMQTIAPHLTKLKAKHKGDAKTLQAETMKLYKEHGVNPVAGCLPLIIQIPLILAFYNVLQQVVGMKQVLLVAQINKVLYFPALRLHSAWDQHFFGLPLGQAPSHLFKIYGPLILLFPIFTALFQFIQSKMITPIKTQEAKEKKKGEEDFATAFQSQSLYLIPLVIGFTSYNFPIGLSLYWNTFTIFGIIQQYIIQGWGGLIEWKDWITKKLNLSS